MKIDIKITPTEIERLIDTGKGRVGNVFITLSDRIEVNYTPNVSHIKINEAVLNELIDKNEYWDCHNSINIKMEV